MSHTDILLQFCVRQDRLVATLDRLHDSLTKALGQQDSGSSLVKKKLTRQLQDLQKRLSSELDHFSQVIQDSAIGQLEVKPQLERLAGRAQQLSQSLSQQYETSREEWRQSVIHLSERATELKNELKKIDLRETLDHVADAVLVDHYAGLGEKKVLQWHRKIWHMIGASLIVSIYLFLPATYHQKMNTFIGFLIVLLIAETARLTLPRFNARVMKDLRPYMRKREVKALTSMTFFAISAFLVCLLFPKGIAVLSVLYLGFGDAFASIVGVKWGRHPLGRRFTLEGTLTFFGVCFLLTFLYPLLVPSYNGPLFLFALLGGIIGAASEWLSFRLDDNLVIPLASASGLQLLLWLL